MNHRKQEKVFYDDPKAKRFEKQIRERRSESNLTLCLYKQLWLMDPEIGGRINRR